MRFGIPVSDVRLNIGRFEEEADANTKPSSGDYATS
jgi:hypothetical protein